MKAIAPHGLEPRFTAGLKYDVLAEHDYFFVLKDNSGNTVPSQKSCGWVVAKEPSNAGSWVILFSCVILLAAGILVPFLPGQMTAAQRTVSIMCYASCSATAWMYWRYVVLCRWRK